MSNPSSGVLYIVATPIGNLGDITVRALEILRSVDMVYAEDTRVTKVLMGRHAIATPVHSYREAAPRPQVERMISEIMTQLEAGKSLAYVSDAGTPGISDPGDYLVRRVREAGFQVVAIPGASSLAALLSVAGAGVQHPLFLGFLPHKKGRETLLRQMAALLQEGPVDGVVLFEGPSRVIKLVQAVKEWSFPVQITIGRELTKKYEEILTGTPAELLAHFEKHEPRGEFVVLVSRNLVA